MNFLLDLSVFSCSSNACLASGQRVIEGLVGSLMHQIELCTSMDSGIEVDEESPGKETEHPCEFSLCSKCTSSIPKVCQYIGSAGSISYLFDLRGVIQGFVNFAWNSSMQPPDMRKSKNCPQTFLMKQKCPHFSAICV